MAYATIEIVTESEKLRELPGVNEVLEWLSPALRRYPHALLVAEIRRALDEMRAAILSGKPCGAAVETRVEEALASIERPSLRRVINATGVVLHTDRKS